jgi:hypothetical protein
MQGRKDDQKDGNETRNISGRFPKCPRTVQPWDLSDAPEDSTPAVAPRAHLESILEKRHMLSRAFYIGIRLGRTVSLSNNPEIDRPNSWNLDLPGTEGRRKGEMEPSQL